MKQTLSALFHAVWGLTAIGLVVGMVMTADMVWSMSQPGWIGSRHDGCHVDLNLTLLSPVALAVLIPSLTIRCYGSRTVRHLIDGLWVVLVALLGFVLALYP